MHSRSILCILGTTTFYVHVYMYIGVKFQHVVQMGTVKIYCVKISKVTQYILFEVTLCTLLLKHTTHSLTVTTCIYLLTDAVLAGRRRPSLTITHWSRSTILLYLYVAWMAHLQSQYVICNQLSRSTQPSYPCVPTKGCKAEIPREQFPRSILV